MNAIVSNSQEITIAQAKGFAAELIKLDMPGWVWGSPGIGKSEIYAQIARELDYNMTEIRLSLFDPVDLRGLPVPDMERRVTEWLRPQIWPILGAKKPTLIFFDEMDRALASVSNAALQIVLGKQIGEHVLPPETRIAAAGNGESDRVGTNKISAAQANRFTHLYARADTKTTADYLASIGVHPAMVAFIRFRGEPDLANNRVGLIQTKPAAGKHAFASPRAWEKCAKFFPLPLEMRFPLMAGTVGHAEAIECNAFLESYAALAGLMNSILSSPATADIPSEPSLLYAVAAALSGKADFNTWAAISTYAARLPDEWQICTVLDAVRRMPALKNTAQYGAWAVNNQAVAL